MIEIELQDSQDLSSKQMSCPQRKSEGLASKRRDTQQQTQTLPGQSWRHSRLQSLTMVTMTLQECFDLEIWEHYPCQGRHRLIWLSPPTQFHICTLRSPWSRLRWHWFQSKTEETRGYCRKKKILSERLWRRNLLNTYDDSGDRSSVPTGP